MKFLGNLLIFTMLTTLSFNAHAAGASLFDAIINGRIVAKAMNELGLVSNERQIVKTSLDKALVSLNGGTVVPSKKKLKMILAKLIKRVEGQDKTRLASVARLLNTKGSNLRGDQLLKITDDLVYLSSRYGTSVDAIHFCVECSAGSLNGKGLTHGLKIITDPKKKSALKRVPSNPKDLRQYLVRNLKSEEFGSGEFNLDSLKVIGPEEERALGFFVEVAKTGTKAQKEFAQSVLAFSKNAQGDTVLLNSENPHLFWKLFSENVSDDELADWTKMLNTVAKTSKGTTDKKAAFLDFLYKKAGDDAAKKKHADTIANNNCFFRK